MRSLLPEIVSRGPNLKYFDLTGDRCQLAVARLVTTMDLMKSEGYHGTPCSTVKVVYALLPHIVNPIGHDACIFHYNFASTES